LTYLLVLLPLAWLAISSLVRRDESRPSQPAFRP
jgi:hypothetical protein